eukprot:4950046-Alexandrium_andersonii.AAC.1
MVLSADATLRVLQDPEANQNGQGLPEGVECRVTLDALVAIEVLGMKVVEPVGDKPGGVLQHAPHAPGGSVRRDE